MYLRLVRQPPLVPLLLWAGVLARTYDGAHVTLWRGALAFLAAAVAEYAAHRWLFHGSHVPRALRYALHGCHHQNHRDMNMVTLPVWVTALLYACLRRLLLPAAWLWWSVLFYLVYDASHVLAHAGLWNPDHARHHTTHPDRFYGVSPGGRLVDALLTPQ